MYQTDKLNIRVEYLKIILRSAFSCCVSWYRTK